MRWLPLLLAAVAAGAPEIAAAQSLSLDMGGEGGGSFTGRVFQPFALVTVLSLAPGLLVMVTSYTRIVVVLSILRTATGLQQSPPNTVLVSLALFLTAFVMAPAFETAYYDGVQPLVQERITEEEAIVRIVDPFRDFMERQAREQDVEMFKEFAGLPKEAGIDAEGVDGAFEVGVPAGEETESKTPLRALIPAFIIGELSHAFQIGFLLFLPFLVIDLVTASLLMSMGMMMLPPVIVSLPFKIIFFVMVDGWALVTASLMKSFGGA